MKLYYVVGSPNCRKVHAVINHLGLDVEMEY
ncbi:MAG: glutathione S-transferase N-terminal domain-containing protein, partial [Gammaproteobacteria bacterium]